MLLYTSILGWFIILGSAIPYSFQYYKIYTKSSVGGISDLMLLSGCASNFFSLMAIVFSNFYKIINSTNYVDKYLLSVPIIQLATSFTLLEISYLLYFLYTEYNHKKIIYILYHIIEVAIFTIIFPILMISLYNSNYVYISLNILSGFFSIIMWAPQIIITCKQKAAGSLSIISLIIQSFGCLLVILFQLLDNSSPTIIIPYIIGFLSELTLVIMCLWYKYRSGKKNQQLLDNMIQ